MRSYFIIAAVASAVIVATAIIWLFPPTDESRIGVDIPKSSTEMHSVAISCDTFHDDINVRFQWNSAPPHPRVYIDHPTYDILQLVVTEPPSQPMVTTVVFETDELTPELFGIIHWDSPWQCYVASASEEIKTYRIEP